MRITPYLMVLSCVLLLTGCSDQKPAAAAVKEAPKDPREVLVLELDAKITAFEAQVAALKAGDVEKAKVLEKSLREFGSSIQVEFAKASELAIQQISKQTSPEGGLQSLQAGMEATRQLQPLTERFSAALRAVEKVAQSGAATTPPANP